MATTNIYDMENPYTYLHTYTHLNQMLRKPYTYLVPKHNYWVLKDITDTTYTTVDDTTTTGMCYSKID